MNLLSGINQDFHRPQKSPGAYEWWHFDATDEKTNTSFSLQFYAGNLFSPYYQNNLKTYWKKTKSPLTTNDSNLGKNTLPNPLDYCGVTFRIFHKDTLINESLEEFPGKFFKASDQQGAVKLGPSRFNWDQTGNPASYVITIQSPIPNTSGYLRARLFFTPLLVNETFDLPKPEITSTHTWILVAPICRVEGTLQWCSATGEIKKEEGFIGTGFHDHHFGTVPLDRFIKSWHWGRIFVAEKTFIYSVQTPIHKNEKTECILLTLNQNKVETISRSFNINPSHNHYNFFLLPYAKILTFNNPYFLRIIHDSILSDGPVSLIFKDKIHYDISGKSLTGFGISNYLYPPRLSNSFFFPMLKAKTTIYTHNADLPMPSSLNQPGSDVFTDRSML